MITVPHMQAGHKCREGKGRPTRREKEGGRERKNTFSLGWHCGGDY